MLDLTHLVWDCDPAQAIGMGGSYQKAYLDGRYYKLGCYNGFEYSKESVNEVIVSDILDIMEIPHVKFFGERARIVPYRGKNEVHETFVCWSEEFRLPGESKMELDTFYELNRQEGDDPFKFCTRMGFTKELDQMLLADFIFINRDRHGANTEVIKSGGRHRLAPMFDTGFSLERAPDSMLANQIDLDVMYDYRTNNFIGSESLFDNLELISEPVEVSPLTEERVAAVVSRFSDSLSEKHIKIDIEMIWERYKYAREKNFLRERR